MAAFRPVPVPTPAVPAMRAVLQYERYQPSYDRVLSEELPDTSDPAGKAQQRGAGGEGGGAAAAAAAAAGQHKLPRVLCLLAPGRRASPHAKWLRCE